MFRVTSRKYYNEWDNGTSFASNTGVFSTHLKGLIGERVKLVEQVEVAQLSQSEESNPFEILNPSGKTLRRQSGSWIADGFAIGQSVSLITNYTSGSATVVFTDTISAITDTEIYLTTSQSTASFTDAVLVCATAFAGLTYYFGLVENDAADNFNSPYTGDAQGYYFGAIDTATPTVHTMNPVGGSTSSKIWESGGATIKWLSSSAPSGGGVNYLHKYELTHTFVISPIWYDSYADIIEDGTLPPDFIGGKSIKHIMQFDFQPVLTNPNIFVTGFDNSQKGSVGWIGENYNGFDNIFSIASTTIIDVSSTDPVDSIQSKSKTRISGTINGAFTNTDKLGAYIIYCATEDQYTAIQDSFQDGFLYDHLIGTMVAGAFDSSGSGIIKRLAANYVNSGAITFILETEYDTTEQEYIGSDGTGRYLVFLQVGDSSGVDSSNKVMLQLGFDEYTVNNDVAGLATFSGQEFYSHNKDYTGAGNTDYKGWKGDGVLFKTTLSLNKADNANLHSLTFRVMAYKDADNQFELQKYSFPLNDIVVVNTTPSYQRLLQSGTRGFKLAENDQFNFANIEFNVPVSNIQDINIVVGFKFDWQSWNRLAAADTVFYDSDLDSLGMGLDASRYSNLNGYVIKVFVDAEIKQLDNNTTLYRDISPDCVIFDWDEDGNTPAGWSKLIETFDTNGNSLNGAILTNQDTKFKTTWTPQSGSTTGWSEAWAIHRIDKRNSVGQKGINELSSIRSYPLGNILKPVDGETQLKITDSGTTIVTECLIDYTKLVGSDYDLFARMGRDKVYGRYNKAKDFKFLDVAKTEAISFNGETVTPLSNALRLCTLDASYNVIAEEAIALTNNYYVNPRFAVDYNEQVNGKSVFYMISYNGTDTTVYRFVYTGSTFNQTVVYTGFLGGSNPSCIRIDESISPNGRALLWYGNKTAIVSGNRGFRTSYWNGASWVNGEFKTGDIGTPATNECCQPVDLIFDNADMYIMNYDSPPQAVNAFKGKISKFYQTSGSLVDPVDRVNPANWSWVNDIYINSADTQDTDGLGSVSDCAFGLGFERLEVDGNSNPVFLVCHDSSLGTGGSRHWSRVYANTASPTGPADWNIQTPMAFTNGSSGGTEAISGTASATAQSSPLRNHKSCHVAIIDGNRWITGNEAFYWVQFFINDWTGATNNVWAINAPNDPGYSFTSGNTLTE